MSCAQPDVEAGVSQPVRVVEFHSLRQLVAPFYLPSFLLQMLKAMANIMLPLELLALGFSYDMVGVLTSLTGLGAVVGNLPAGRLVSSKGSKVGSAVASVFFALAAACAVLVTVMPPETWSLLLLGFGFFAVGCGDTVGVVARVTLLGSTVRPSLRGRAAATLGGFLRAGFTFGPLLAGVVAEFAMSRSVYLLMMGLSVLAFLISQLCIPSFDPNQSIQHGQLKAKEPQGTKVKDVETLALTTWQVAKTYRRILCTGGLFSSALLLVRRARELFFALEGEHLGLSPSQIGAVTALSFAVDGLLFPLAGWMLDRLGRVRTGALSMLGLGASLLILNGDTFPFFVAFAVVSGLFNGISAGIVQVMAADLAPAHCRSQFVGIFRMLALCADIAAPSLVGAVAELTSLKTAGVIMAAAGALGAAFGLTFMRETADLNQRGKEAKQALESAPCKPEEIGKGAPTDVSLTKI
jgi:MFS family permease